MQQLVLARLSESSHSRAGAVGDQDLRQLAAAGVFAALPKDDPEGGCLGREYYAR
jgi:hypothetical protein